MRFVIVCCVALTIYGCGEKTQKQIESSLPASAVMPALVLTSAEIFAAFQKDIATCKSAVNTFESDHAFVLDFGDAEKRSSKPLEDFLRRASFAKSGDIQYILANLKYFEIGVTYHPTEFAIAWAKSEPIFCALTQQRLKEIEMIGESPEAWEIRVDFLDRWLADLRPPSDELDYYPEQYEEFNRFILEAAKLYSSSHRPKFLSWAKKSIEHFESQRGQLEEGAGGQTLAEQNKIIDSEVLFLRSLIEPSRTETSGVVQAASSPATPTPSNMPPPGN